MGSVLPLNATAAESPTAPQTVSKSEVAAPAAVTVSDVALQKDNVLEGQVIDSKGQPVVGAPISLLQRQKEIASVKTAADGTFHVNGVRGGVYQVISNSSNDTYRAWPEGAAPPAAKPKIILTQSSEESRGPVLQALSNPWVLVGAAAIATAIAVPLALANRHHGSSS